VVDTPHSNQPDTPPEHPDTSLSKWLKSIQSTWLENIRLKWLLIIALVGIAIFLMPTPQGLSEEGKKTLVILVVAAGAFVTDALPVPGMALLIPILLTAFQIKSPDEVAHSMMSDSVLFIIGSLMIAVVLTNHGIDKRIASLLLARAGTSTNRVALAIVTSCALLSSFMSDHMVAAVMLPVGITIVESAREEKSPVLGKLIMFCIAYGCAIGGMGTPSGGARNAIMIAYLQENFGIHLGYGQWAAAALPIVLINIPVTTFLLTRIWNPEVKELKSVLETLKKEGENMGPLKNEGKVVLAIFGLVVVLWVTVGDTFGLGMVSLFGAVLYIILGLVDWAEYQRKVAWGVVLLYAGAISLGIAMIETGAASFIAHKFLLFLYGIGFTSENSFVASAGFLTMMMTQGMSNGAAVAVLGPINLNLAALAGVGLTRVGLTTACSAAFAYVMVIGTPPNAIVSSSGYVLPRDFLKVGIIQLLVSFLLLIFFIYVVWGFIGI
jgi:sodium-dependent dicarboxylate transporter 2/3/5